MRCHRHQPQQEMATDSQQHASLAADKDASQGRALSPERSQQPVWSGLAQEPTGKSAPDHSPRTAAGFLTTENPSKEIPLCEPSNPHSPPTSRAPGHQWVTKVLPCSTAQLPPQRGNAGIPQGHNSSQLYSRGASLSKLDMSPNQKKRAKRSRNGFNYSEAAKQGSSP